MKKKIMENNKFKWESYPDLSGSLRYGNKEFFIYDGTTIPGGIEIKQPQSH